VQIVDILNTFCEQTLANNSDHKKIKVTGRHKTVELGKHVGDSLKQLTGDAENIAAGIDKCRDMLESLEKEKNEFVEQVEKTGVEISERAEQLKQMIDIHKEKLMNELSSMIVRGLRGSCVQSYVP